jgi:diguanylate cyclase (GGDEF)-like protein/PAS domain S-box-containing protein
MLSVDLFRVLLDDLFEGVYFVDADRRIVYWNKAAERITGYRSDEVVGRFCAEGILCHVDETGRRLCGGACPLAATMKDRERRTTHIYLHHAQGHRVPVRVASTPIQDPSGKIIGAVESFVEDSEWRVAEERIAELERFAFLDTLTELPNRRYLERTLDAKLEERNRYGWPCAVMLIDVDHFKSVNDEHGHGVGDSVLRMVARTLQRAVRGSDLAGRWGGEEFLVIVSNATPDTTVNVAERIRALVAASNLSAPASISVTVSVGAAVVSGGESAAQLVRRADESLYQAKHGGRNMVCVDGVSSRPRSRLQDRYSGGS